MEKECMNCGGSIYFQCRKEVAKYNDRLSSREGASEMLNVSVQRYLLTRSTRLRSRLTRMTRDLTQSF